PAPSFSIRAVRLFAKAPCASAESLVTAGSTIFRQTEVLERTAGSAARKSTHGVRLTQSAIALVLASARATNPSSPPTAFAQASVSSQSSTHSIDGVLMVSPSKIASLSLPPLVMRKIFGSGQAGL